MLVRERVERKLEKSGRITPSEVLTAYERTGLEPVAEEFWTENGACAIGVLMDAEGVERRLRHIKPWLNQRGLSSMVPYMNGFYRGFDGLSPLAGPDAECPDFRTGFRDGRRVRRFVFAGSGQTGKGRDG